MTTLGSDLRRCERYVVPLVLRQELMNHRLDRCRQKFVAY